MRFIDSIALKIYSELVREYETNSKENGPFLNIFGIFMHVIMVYLSNYIIISRSSFNYGEKVNFPYLNSSYTNQPFKLTFEDNLNLTTVKERLPLILLSLNLTGKKVMLGNNLEKDVVFYFLRYFRKFRCDRIRNPKIYLPNKNKQIAKLRKYLFDFCENYKVRNSDYFVSNLIDYIEKYLTEQKITIKSEFFLSGSNCILENRITAAKFLSQDKKVIAFAHGDSDMLVLDDPYGGYADMSYCNFYVSYGTCNLSFGEYNSPLKYHNPIILRRSSKEVQKKLSLKNIKPPDCKLKGLYIPTGFSGNERYGPFRDMDDGVYIEWQKAILDSGLDLDYKVYPTNKGEMVSYKDLGSNVNYIYKNLKEIDLKPYNFIVLDFMSTGFTLGVASSLPVIYFNLGLMNIASSVVDEMKKRVFWFDVDISKNHNNQIRDGYKVFFNSKRKYINSYSRKYSLSDQSTESILGSVII